MITKNRFLPTTNYGFLYSTMTLHSSFIIVVIHIYTYTYFFYFYVYPDSQKSNGSAIVQAITRTCFRRCQNMVFRLKLNRDMTKI